MTAPDSRCIADDILREKVQEQTLWRLMEAMERQAEASALIARTLVEIRDRLPLVSASPQG